MASIAEAGNGGSNSRLAAHHERVALPRLQADAVALYVDGLASGILWALNNSAEVAAHVVALAMQEPARIRVSAPSTLGAHSGSHPRMAADSARFSLYPSGKEGERERGTVLDHELLRRFCRNSLPPSLPLFHTHTHTQTHTHTHTHTQTHTHTHTYTRFCNIVKGRSARHPLRTKAGAGRAGGG
jgi:hypothetical protein